MAPIHETDIAQERWQTEEWRHYEFWEKVEVRDRRKRRLWILGAFLVFLLLSSVPVVMERWPKWVALEATRELARQVDLMKRDAARDYGAYRLRFVGAAGLPDTAGGGVRYVVERLESCARASGGVEARSGELLRGRFRGSFGVVSPEDAAALEVPGLVAQICYDALSGISVGTTVDQAPGADTVLGIGVMSARDLAEKRVDRMAVLLMRGPSGDLSFN